MMQDTVMVRNTCNRKPYTLSVTTIVDDVELHLRMLPRFYSAVLLQFYPWDCEWYQDGWTLQYPVDFCWCTT